MRMMSKCLTWFPIGGFRKTQVIPEYVVFYKNVGRIWRVSDCEELVLFKHSKWWGRFLGIHFCNIHLKTAIRTWEVR